MRFAEIESALSVERFSRYLAWAGGDRDRAISLYSLNTRLSECLYTPLQMLEIALRNRIHAILAEAKGDNWFESDVIQVPYQEAQIAQAMAELRKSGKEVSGGAIVAGLTFSFWTTMFSKEYEALWQQVLHGIASPGAPKGLKRKSFTGPLTRIRILRNRIAHHEPILGWDLRKHHACIIELIEWLSSPAAELCHTNDRFKDTFPAEGVLLHTFQPNHETAVADEIQTHP